MKLGFVKGAEQMTPNKTCFPVNPNSKMRVRKGAKKHACVMHLHTYTHTHTHTHTHAHFTVLKLKPHWQ